MFETNFSERHNLSAGLSLNHDYFGQLYRLSHSATDATRDNEKETTPGVYAQYTLTLGKTLTAMAGIRADHSSVYGTFVTPRFHIKYAPSKASGASPCRRARATARCMPSPKTITFSLPDDALPSTH